MMRSWLDSFLADRYQYVIYGSSRSQLFYVTSGVCQGSALGPLLFIIYMLDLPACISGPVAQYADDTTLYRQISSTEDAKILQEDLNHVSLWCQLNNMALNPTKSTYLRVTRSTHPIDTSYSICNLQVPSVKAVKILGVTVTSDLKWNNHTAVIRNKAAKTLGFISRCFKGAKCSVISLLYKSLVRSSLLFAAPAWHPTTGANLAALERVQNRATRLILGCKKSDTRSSDARRAACGLPSLGELWDKITLSFFCKCLTGACDLLVFHPDRVTVKPRRVGLRGDRCVLTTPRSTCSAYLASFFPRAVSLFQTLPEEVRLKHVPAPSQ